MHLHFRSTRICNRYICHPLAPFRIRALLPDVKIVATVREPVERAFSGFCHLFKTYFMNKLGLTPLTFTEIVDQGIKLVQDYRVSISNSGMGCV